MDRVHNYVIGGNGKTVKETPSFAKSTDTAAKQTITDAKPTCTEITLDGVHRGIRRNHTLGKS